MGGRGASSNLTGKNVLAGKTFYHGSPKKNITSFSEKLAGSNTGVDNTGIFFTDNKDFANDFSYQQLQGSSFLTVKKGEKGSVYEVELNMKKPLNLNKLTKAQMEDINKNYLADNGFSKEFNAKNFKEFLEAGNIQGAKMYIDLNKIAKSNKYDGYIADLGGKYKGSNEYVVFKGNQAKIKKEY